MTAADPAPASPAVSWTHISPTANSPGQHCGITLRRDAGLPERLQRDDDAGRGVEVGGQGGVLGVVVVAGLELHRAGQALSAQPQSSHPQETVCHGVSEMLQNESS